MSTIEDTVWTVNGDTSRYWSPLQRAWLAELPAAEDTGIELAVRDAATEADITDALRPHLLPGPVATRIDVWVERDRRLAAGFDYDFGDERGVHHFATTPGDMIGWSDVTTWAQIQAITGNPTATLTIKTETGYAEVTPGDWFGALNHYATIRQAIWAASFALESSTPVPADYADDVYWGVL